MSGLANASDAILNAIGNTGAALRSKAQYEEDRALNSERIKQAQQGTAIGADQATELARKRAAEAEERDAASDYARRSAPGYFGGQQQPAAAPAPAPAPTETAAAGGSQPTEEAPTEQPIPTTAVPGSTLSSSPVPAPKAPTPPQAAAITPGGAPSLNAPPRMASPAPAAPPTAPAQPGGGRVGLLDVLAKKALERGDTARYNELQAQKQALDKEGFGQAAHEALLDPTNVRKIEETFNQYGARRLVPGSLVYEGAGKYSGAVLSDDGSVRPFQHFDMLHAAMSLGVIAPPTMKGFKSDENVFSVDPTGAINQVQTAHKFVTTMNRSGDIVTTNQQTGETHVQTAGGGEGRLSSTQNSGIREIMQLVGRVSKERSDQLPGAKENKPRLEQARVASTAQSIYLNNPELERNGPLAAEIAIAVNDGDKSASTGTAMRDGAMWNVVKYGEGKNQKIYAISRVPTQPAAAPAAPRAAPTAPPPAAPPAVVAGPAAAPPPAPAPAPAPQLPRPPRPAEAQQPAEELPQSEKLGLTIDKLRDAIKEANTRLHSIGAVQLKKDPQAAENVRKEVKMLESSLRSAQSQYEQQVGRGQAVTGRASRP